MEFRVEGFLSWIACSLLSTVQSRPRTDDLEQNLEAVWQGPDLRMMQKLPANHFIATASVAR